MQAAASRYPISPTELLTFRVSDLLGVWLTVCVSVRLPICLSSKGGGTERPERRGWVVGVVDGRLVNGFDGRKRACGMRTIPGDTD
jgi:hypothetical protein